MYYLDHLLPSIETNFERKKNKQLNAIPFGLERFDKKFVGWVQGTMYCITAATGVGKTQAAKNLAVQRPLEFIKKNPDVKVNYKVLWFGLEETKKDFYLSMLSNFLHREFNELTDTHDLMSRKKEDTLSEEDLKKLRDPKILEYFKFFDEHVEMYEDLFTPSAIYLKLMEYAIKAGKFYKDGNEVTPKRKKRAYQYIDTETGQIYNSYDHYEPNDPNEYVLVAVDHISLAELEKEDSSLHAAMSRLVTRIMRLIFCKRMNWIGLAVHQQVMDGDQQNFKGDDIRPSVSKFGDNKLVARDRESFVIYFVYLYLIITNIHHAKKERI